MRLLQLEYVEKLNHYLNLEYIESAFKLKVSSQNVGYVIKEEEKSISKLIGDQDNLILLDAKGKEFDSVRFAHFLQNLLNSRKNPAFIIGGPFGFSDEFKKNTGSGISLSKMTFTHQMTGLIFLEQLFRAMKILNNEKYHY